MPAVSRNQQQAAAIALHHPEKLFKRNRALARMGAATLRKFARTKHIGIPNTANSFKSMKRRMKQL